MKIRQVEAALFWSIAVLSPMKGIQAQAPPARLQISPPAIDFGETAIDSQAPMRVLTLTNSTKFNITMEQIITSGIDFSQKNDCSHILAAGAQCTIQVFFKPAISGPRIGNLGVTGTDPASPHFVALTGFGK